MVSRFFAVILLCVSALGSYADSLIASVDRDQLGINETLNLSLSYQGSASQAPDTSGLENDFHVLGQQQSQRVQINNGSVSREQQWLLSLQPKRAGQLTIPAFELAGSSSLPIQITVSDSASAANKNSSSNSSETLYGETDVDVLNPYVQQQIILTWRLVSKLNVDGVNMAPPDFGDALSLDLGAKRYQRAGANGQTEIVIEQRYALFPQRSGELLIAGHYFQAELLMNRGNFFGGSQAVNIATPALTLQVKPAANNRAAWLPATQLKLSDKLSSQRVTTGEPFTRQIIISAESILAEQLPTLSTDVPGLKRYAEPARRQNDHQGNVVNSQVISSETLIAEQAGPLSLPALKVVWFDTKHNEWREAQIPAQTIDVVAAAGSSVSQAPSNTSASQITADSAPDTNAEADNPAVQTTDNTTAAEASESSAPGELMGWRNVALLFATLLALSIAANALLCLRLRNVKPGPEQSSAMPRSSALDWQSALAKQDAKALYRVLLAAQRNKPAAAQQALLDELSAHLYQQAPANWASWQQQLNAIGSGKARQTAKPDLGNLYAQ